MIGLQLICILFLEVSCSNLDFKKPKDVSTIDPTSLPKIPNTEIRKSNWTKPVENSFHSFSQKCLSCYNLIWEGDVHEKCLMHRKCISKSSLYWDPVGCRDCKTMGAASTTTDSPFAITVAKTIRQWREDNNLPSDGNVDLPMKRCPRDDRINLKGTSNSSYKASFLDKGSALSLQLRQIANSELGVTMLQDVFNSLPYISDFTDEEEALTKMVQSLEEKLKIYSKLLEEMADIVKSSYSTYAKRMKKNQKISSNSLVLDFGLEGQVLEEQQEYYPCCVIPDHYLIFNPHFGTRVNTELWCDSGIEQESKKSPSQIFFTPIKLTEMFSMNHHLYPNLKWQFFMSSNGVHTEFPAHRSGTSVGSDCGQSSRHHQIYEKTIRPNGRNIVLLFDHGNTIRARLLLTAKAIGHYIIDTLTPKDHIAALGVSGSASFPTPICMATRLMSADYDVKRSLRHFIDYLEFQNVSTNHSLGFEKALEIIENWPMSDNRINGEATKIILIYISTGYIENVDEIEDVMKVLAERTNSLRASVVISAFALGITPSEPSVQNKFLETLVNQDYSKYGLFGKNPIGVGEVIIVPSTLRVASIIKDFYKVMDQPKPLKFSNDSAEINRVKISDVYWDNEGNGMVVSFSKAVVTENAEIVGVVGIDISLALLLEYATYFYSPDGGYAMVMDSKGYVLGHPSMGRPRLLDSPLIATPATLLESSASFKHLAPHMLSLSSGHKRNSISSYDSKDLREYWWKTSLSFGWVFIISVEDKRRFGQKLAPDILSLPSHAIFHRLDLLSPQEAKVCRHFNQMATLDGAAIFLSSSTYVSPNTYLATSFRNLNVDMNMMAYLMDNSNLLANPGLKPKIKTESGALHYIADHWKELSQSSKFQKYIIRRYGATLSGVTLIYPGTLLDASYDPTAQGWFIRAIERPGKVIVSPPFLDPGGAGYIVTVSHTVYQGRSAALHSSSDPVLAVLAADFTLGYWHKLLSDIEPECAKSIFFKELNVNESSKNNNIRCFLMDTSGYLIVHPSFVDPFSLRDMGHNQPRHITHQEPVLSMSLLGQGISSPNSENHTPILKKIWCSKQWKGASERYYAVDLSVGKLVSNHIINKGQFKNERLCLQYKLTAVPGSNLILGFINQTCSPPTAFCPCSTVDRPCLNCQFMEKAACECPCECALPSQPCSELPYSSLTSHKGHLDISVSNTSLGLLSNFENGSNSSLFNEGMKERLGAPLTCPRTPESPAPLHYGIGLLSQLSVCMPIMCESHHSIHSCLGVLDCTWCVLESDRQTSLDTPYCTQSHKCYGGIRGGPSPYPPGLAPLSHSEERGSSLPIVPVICGILVIFLLLGVAIYFYRTYTGGTSNRTAYTPSSFQTQAHHSQLYTADVYQDIENVDGSLIDDVIISAEAAAAISPYRMNPTYRRPPTAQGEASDHGYSTMTPHEESDNLTYTDLVTSSYFPASLNDNNRGPSRCWSDSANHELVAQTSVPYNDVAGGYYQTPLSSPKRIGPNKLIVPVTVHMVDTV